MEPVNSESIVKQVIHAVEERIQSLQDEVHALRLKRAEDFKYFENYVHDYVAARMQQLTDAMRAEREREIAQIVQKVFSVEQSLTQSIINVQTHLREEFLHATTHTVVGDVDFAAIRSQIDTTKARATQTGAIFTKAIKDIQKQLRDLNSQLPKIQNCDIATSSITAPLED